MPNGTTVEQPIELISTTVEELLASLGSGIGRAQAELDRHSIEIQKQILEDPVLSQYGLEATWYQIPTTELERKIALVIESTKASTQNPSLMPSGQEKRPLPECGPEPVNARYKNQFSFDFQAASTIKLSVVAVPPPSSGTSRPNLDESAVMAASMPYLFKDEEGNPEPRVTVNFNSGAHAWYIVQSSESGDVVQLRALVRVDDETSVVTKRTGGPGE